MKKEVKRLVESVIAENVRKIIDRKGLKHRAVATKAGFSDKQFSAILTRRRVIKDIDVAAIANALEVTPNELFGIAEPEVPKSGQ